MKNIYLCIDLKTFFASVECVERHLDPFQDNLVVADESRGKGALCLAVTTKMKQLGIKNRCRLYEIPDNIHYLIAKPRMTLYMDYAARVYGVYLKYIAKEDIHIYSIDEAFLDITHYIQLYQKTPKQITLMILDDIYQTTGLTATAGIGTNLFLAKVALDIVAKHVDSHIAILNEERFQKYLWNYQPITDFWQIGYGIANRLAKRGIVNMYGIAHYPEKLLYKEFGINAKYLIDHAWGKESTTIADIKKYKPQNNSISHSQILFEDYDYQEALLVMKEMVELKVLDLVDKHLVSDQIALAVGYANKEIKATGGSMKIEVMTNSYKILLHEFIRLFKKTTNPDYKIRSISISFQHVLHDIYETYTLFSDLEQLEKEKKLNETVALLRHKYGKNSMIKGMNLLEKATTIKRNTLIGGHNAK